MSTPTLPRPRIDVEAEQWREGASKRTQDQVEAFYEVQEGELRLDDGRLAALVMKGIEEGPLDQASLRVPIALPRTSAISFRSHFILVFSTRCFSSNFKVFLIASGSSARPSKSQPSSCRCS
jgi:hypothetical protein